MRQKLARLLSVSALAIASTAVTAVVPLAVAHADTIPSYTFYDLGPYEQVTALSNNDIAEGVQYVNKTEPHYRVWDHGTLIKDDLSVDGDSQSAQSAWITPAGDVYGLQQRTSVTHQSSVWKSPGYALTDFSAPGTNNYLSAVNPSGSQLGWSNGGISDPLGKNYRALTGVSGGVRGLTATTFWGVNGSGSSQTNVIGSIATGKVTSTFSMYGTAMASDGTIVGTPTSSDTTGIERKPDGTIVNLGIQSPGLVSSNGDIVAPKFNYAALYLSGSTTPIPLASLLPAGYDSTTVFAINDNGDMVGDSYDGGTDEGWMLVRGAKQLSISSLTLDPAHPTVEDGSIDATLVVRNDYAGTITAVAPTLTSSDPGSLEVSTGPTPASTATLAAGATATFTYTLTPLQAATVNLTPSATAKDPDGKAITAHAVPPRVVDLSPGDVSIAVSGNPSDPSVNNPTTASATITNKTTSTLTDLSARLTGTPSDTLTIGDPSVATVASLAPHASVAVTWQVTGTAAATYDLKAEVDLTDPTTGEETDEGHGRLPVGETITVNSSGDEPEADGSVAEMICDVDADTAGNQCTLRAAIQLVDSLSTPQTVVFNVPGGSIAPATPLPAISQSVTLDGTTQPGGWLELSGASAGGGDGLTVSGGAATITGFVVNGWASGSGINITDGSGSVIRGDRIGTNVAGTSAVRNATGITDSGGNALIGGTGGASVGTCAGDCVLVSGNDFGISVDAPDSLRVQGSYIGTDVSGTSALPNTIGIGNTDTNGHSNYHDGRAGAVAIGAAASVPGTAPGNIISGNSISGISFDSAGAVTVSGNLIGLDATGTKTLQPTIPVADQTNVMAGVYVHQDRSVLVGGSTLSAGNVISGFPVGVLEDLYTTTLADSVTDVQNDRIGTDVAGTKAIPNRVGVGGVRTVEDSVISGNTTGIGGAAKVIGNLIGTTADGESALPNDYGVSGTQIGGVRASGSTSCDSPCNVISGNLINGVMSAETVQGNFVGTDLAGAKAIPNDPDNTVHDGYWAVGSTKLVGGASHALAGTCDLACNVIAGNGTTAVETRINPGVLVEGNQIGLAADGTTLPNKGIGIETTVRSVIGGDGALGNVIEHGTGAAVQETSGELDQVYGNKMIDNADGIALGGATGRATRTPSLAGAVRIPTGIVITGDVLDLTSAPGNDARLDIYGVSASCDAPVEGEIPLGHVESTLTGGAAFRLGTPITTGVDFITATSTEGDHTSVFASCIPVTTASTVTPAPGGRTSATAPGFTSGEPVSVDLHSTPIHVGTVTATSAGIASAALTIPRSLTAGLHHLVFTGKTSGVVVSIPITVTPAPQAGLLRFVKPAALYSGTVKKTTTLKVAGRAGIPAKGARRALVLIRTTGDITVDGVPVKANTSRLVPLSVGIATIKEKKPASVSLVALGWYVAATSNIGDLYRTLPSIAVPNGVVAAGTRGIPAAGDDAVQVVVKNAHAVVVVAGVTLRPSAQPQSIAARFVNGKLAISLPKGATATIVGWYGGPAVAAGGRTTG